MKKNVLLLVAMLVLFIFGGCGKKEASNKVKVGVAISNFDDQFLISMVDKMKAFAAENYADEMEVTFVDGKDDPAKQLGQIENFVTQGMDKIIIVPVDSETSDTISKMVIDAGIDIIYCNRPPQNVFEGVYAVVSPQKDAGVMQMEYLAEKAGYKGNVVVLMGILGHDAQIKRTEGFEEVIAKYPDMKIIKKQTGQWNRALGLQVMENWLNSGDQIDIVASNNDEMAIGAISAIEAAGKLDDIIVGGVDGTADAVDMIAKGKQDVSIFQDGTGQGVGAIEVAYKLWKGEPVEQVTNVPFQLITPENYKDFQ